MKALVLKTSDVERHRGFESLSLRQMHMEKYPRGRRGSPAKGVGCDKRRPGSNPGFSAQSVFREESGFLVVYDVVFWAAGFCHTPPVKSEAGCEMRSAEFVDQCFLKDS